MRQPWGWAALAAVLLSLAPAPAVRADDPADEFKAHVQRAKVHYELAEFDDAAEEYIQAYRIKPVPGALFNIAQAYRQAGKYDKSRQFYRSYLREAALEGKAKASVEKQIRELDELIAKEEKTRRSAPTGVKPSLTAGGDDLAPPTSGKPTPPAANTDFAPPSAKPVPSAKAVPAPQASATTPASSAQPSTPPVSSSPAPLQNKPANKPSASDSRPRPQPAPVAPPAAVRSDSIETRAYPAPSHTAAYVIGAVGLAVLGGGAFFGVEAARADNELTAGPHTTADGDSLISTSKSDHTLSAVLLGAGAAAVVCAGVLYFLPVSGPSGGAGASVGGRF